MSRGSRQGAVGRRSEHPHLRLVMDDDEAELLDISSLLDRIEAQLCGSAESESTADSLALLRSWGWNSMLNESCQRRARALLARFDPGH